MVGGDVVYLRDFSRIVNERDSVEDIVAAMLELHGDRDNPACCGTPPALPSPSAADRPVVNGLVG